MSRSGGAWDALGSSARLWVRCVPTAWRLRLVSRHPPRPRAVVTCPCRRCHRHPTSPEGAFLRFRSSANTWRQAAAPLRLHHGSAAGPRPSSCPRDTRGPPWCPGRLRRCSSRDPGVAARSSGTSRPRVSRPHFRSVSTRVSARGLFFFFFLVSFTAVLFGSTERTGQDLCSGSTVVSRQTNILISFSCRPARERASAPQARAERVHAARPRRARPCTRTRVQRKREFLIPASKC